MNQAIGGINELLLVLLGVIMAQLLHYKSLYLLVDVHW